MTAPCLIINASGGGPRFREFPWSASKVDKATNRTRVCFVTGHISQWRGSGLARLGALSGEVRGRTWWPQQVRVWVLKNSGMMLGWACLLSQDYSKVRSELTEDAHTVKGQQRQSTGSTLPTPSSLSTWQTYWGGDGGGRRECNTLHWPLHSSQVESRPNLGQSCQAPHSNNSHA